ncbi:DUF1851 domain-containing protein [Calidifontibacter sp. DB0510]|uniref:DUF1851 domain-containing protein n=1 Tax=Metallococcus carri TaxID=1656884 RepID=A0A967B1Y2_9MICO|nr:GAD-like domain-containing protein [Metallococcus carri]NHN55895.1 DUF1851 domain-containing protein [Metallococcus carri]NOP38417.1 DUF1851 domain-containing protein [Calidifontibacter sp. DB2511S]
MTDQQPERFTEAYPPDGDARVPSGAFLAYAEGKVAPELLQVWRSTGLGFYGEQRIALVDPGVWLPVLTTWLGHDTGTLPAAVTSFGHLYHAGPSGPVQCLDPHFVTNTVVAPDMASFLGEHLPGPSSHLADLEGPRGGARARFGELAEGETYYFDPAIALGGQVSPNTLAKGDGVAEFTRIHAGLRQRRAG